MLLVDGVWEGLTGSGGNYVDLGTDFKPGTNSFSVAVWFRLNAEAHASTNYYIPILGSGQVSNSKGPFLGA